MNVDNATQLVIVAIELKDVILVVDAISLNQSQELAAHALMDVSVVLIMIIADAVLLDTGQTNMFASNAHLNAHFAGLLLIAMLVFVDGTLINAAFVILQLFLVSHVIPNVSDVMDYTIAWSAEVAITLVKECARIVAHTAQFAKMINFAQSVTRDTILMLTENALNAKLDAMIVVTLTPA